MKVLVSAWIIAFVTSLLLLKAPSAFTAAAIATAVGVGAALINMTVAPSLRRYLARHDD